MLICKKYSSKDKKNWNKFLKEAKNCTFIFDRNYMDYHSNIYEDYSLMIYKKNKIISIIPANINNKELISHQGLTYGGFVFRKEEKMNNILKIIRCVLKFLLEKDIKNLYYKSIPKFYNTIGSDEVDYALFILGAKLYRRDTTMNISLFDKINYQIRRNRSIKKAIKLGISIKRDYSFKSFWNQILTPNLKERFGVLPVHNLDEINLLSSRFPENIKQYNAYLDEKIIAGTTIFETPTVAHAQYISASNIGKKDGALDLLFDSLISKIYSNKKYFDLGISNEKKGKKINHGLLDWKEGFGGRSFSHNFYKINCKNYYKLNDVIKDEFLRTL